MSELVERRYFEGTESVDWEIWEVDETWYFFNRFSSRIDVWILADHSVLSYFKILDSLKSHHHLGSFCPPCREGWTHTYHIADPLIFMAELVLS